jgi:hypothetical protein
MQGSMHCNGQKNAVHRSVPSRAAKDLAGIQTTVVEDSTDFVTHAPAPMMAPSPIRRGDSAVPLIIKAPVPMCTRAPTCT